MSAHRRLTAQTRRLALAVAYVRAAATAAQAHPGSGIVVGRDGRVFFVLFGPNRIMVREPDGRVRVFAEDDRWLRLHHLVLDSAGNLYTTSDHDGRVWRIAPDGRVTEFFFNPRLWGERGIMIGSGGDPFTLDTEGNVYALDRPSGSNIRRITPAGDVLAFAELERPQFQPRRQGLHSSSMAWGPDRALYVTDAERVWRIAPGGSAAPLDLGGDRLELGTGLAVDADGSVFVADYRGRRVLMIRPGGRGAVEAPGTGRLRLRGPMGVALGPDSALYVTDFGPGIMVVWRVTAGRARGVYRRWESHIIGPQILVAVFVLLIALITLQRQPKGMTDWLWWTVFAGLVVVGFWRLARGLPVLAFWRHVLILVYVWAAIVSYLRRGPPQAAQAG
jgi:sugar lactone lactonase YvrE